MEVRKNSVRAWVLAARPKTLSGAAVPVMVGCALAYNAGCFEWIPAVACLMFAFLMQIDANLVNDLFDFLKGSDNEGRLGPERACAQGWITAGAMKAGIAAVTVAAAASGCVLLFYGGWELAAIGACCMLFAFLYTAGPYPLAYHGWGDLLVFVFFGIVPVCTIYYIMCGNIGPGAVMYAAACGAVIDTLLLVNNIRDCEQDRAGGKNTLVVIAGKRFGQWLYLFAGIAGAALCLSSMFFGARFSALLPLMYLLPHCLAYVKIKRIGEGRMLNLALADTSRNMLLFGLLVSAGLAADGINGFILE